MKPEKRTTQAERRSVWQMHTRSDVRYLDEPDAEGRTEVPRSIPVCSWCGEQWDEHGCTTVRLLNDVLVAEGQIAGAERRAFEAGLERDDAQRAMMKVGSLSHWRIRPENRVWECSMQIAGEVLAVRGGAMAIDYALIDLGKQMKAKHKELNRDRDEEMAVALNTLLWSKQKGQPLDFDVLPPMTTEGHTP